MSARKPYNRDAGYVSMRTCHVPGVGGHIVVYDRVLTDIDGDEPWVVMHRPSSLHVCVRSKKLALEIMVGVANAANVEKAREYADILPREDEL